jgi:hypothetical protein
MEIGAVGRHDAARLLPSMLEGKQPQLSQRRRFSMAKDAENTAFLVKFVERKVHQFKG